MGYACPVCGDPQQDAGHLANHLAFTALLGGGDHEAWLDEHAPGWAEEGEADLAERVVDHADERAFPQVFEDTTGDDGGHGEGQGHPPNGREEAAGVEPPHDEATRDVLAAARALTEEMRDEDDDGS